MIRLTLISLFRIFLILPGTWNFVAPLAGAFIGVVGGFLVQLVIMAIRDQRRKEEEKCRKKYILEILKDEISHNVKLLEQIKREYNTHEWVGYYNLDTTTRQAIWAELIKLEEDAQFVNKLSRVYYEFEHMNRKLDFQLNSAMFGVRDIRIANLRSKVVGSIISHIDKSLLRDSEDKLRKIEDKLK